jgi:DNA invertase Pin-like site-specific DNA recombinase
MLVGYARVSTQDQSLDRQIDALEAAGVDKRNIYQEKITGTKKDRPELIRMIGELQTKDTVICVELSRISRSTKDLLEIVEQIGMKGADIQSLKENWINTTTAHGKMFFTFIAGMNQFERDIISERTKEGLKAAKARGRRGGRPSGQNKHSETVLAMYRGGATKTEITNALPISYSTVERIIRNC